MYKKKFSLVSVVAMIIAAVVITWINFIFPGYELGGTLGVPFAWYWVHDLIQPGKPNSGIYWFGLIANIMIWNALIIVFGLLFESFISKLALRKSE